MRIILKITAFAFTIALSILSFSACNTSKNSINKSDYTKVTSKEDLSKRHTEMIETFVKWRDVSLPFKFTMNGSKSISISGRAELKYNESIAMSFRVMGFEVAKLFVTNDSIFAYEKINNRYISESLQKVRKDFPFSLKEIQKLLLGEPTQVLTEKYHETPTYNFINENLWEIAYKKPITYKFGIDGNNRLVNFLTEQKPKFAVCADYSEHTQTDYGVYPSYTEITIQDSKKSYSMNLSWSFNSAKWNTGVKPYWSAPKGYTKITTDKLINLLSGQ